MTQEFQVVVYDKDNFICSSNHFDDEPSDKILHELLSEGSKLECYYVEVDEYSKHIFTLIK